MKRIAVISAVVLVFTGALAAGFTLLLSPSFLADEMARAVEQASGKKLSFGSGPRLTLWPEFGVAFGNVRLDNARDFSELPFATVEEMRVRIAAAALIGRRAAIDEVRLVRPRLNLFMDQAGHGNWMQDAAPTAGASPPVPPLYVEGGTVTFGDERSGQRVRLGDLDMLMTLQSAKGPLEVKGSGNWHNDRMSFSLFIKSPQSLAEKGSPVDLNVSGSWIDLGFSGRGAIAEEIDLAGTLEGNSRSLRGLLRWAGLEIGDGKGFERFRTSGAFRLRGNSFALSKAQFRLDGMNAQGDAALDFKSGKPILTLALGIDHLDLNRYGLGSSLFSGEADEGIERWGLQPIDFSLLNSFDAKATLTADRVIFGRAIMSHARLNGTIGNGVLNAKLEHIDLHQGKAKGQLVLNGAQKAPIVQVGLDAENIDANALLGGASGRLKGRAEASMALAATGRSPRELIASLRGTAGVAIRDGALAGIDVEQMAQEVAEKIVVGWTANAQATTRFDLLKGNFKLADGIAETSDLDAAGPGLKLKGKGLIDLLKGEIEMKIEPEFSAHAMNIPLMISGPLSRPKLYPDIAGVLENPAAAYEALKALLSRAAGRPGGAGTPETATTNAGGVAGEALSSEADAGTPAHSVDLKKELNTNTIDLMNGFTGDSEPEALSTDP
jgi:uncharacterized protein involved in outer membrane biogenesis